MVTIVQIRVRCGSIIADLATTGPQATPETASACRTEACKPTLQRWAGGSRRSGQSGGWTHVCWNAALPSVLVAREAGRTGDEGDAAGAAARFLPGLRSSPGGDPELQRREDSLRLAGQS